LEKIGYQRSGTKLDEVMFLAGDIKKGKEFADNLRF
jgi:hypothetical protein